MLLAAGLVLAHVPFFDTSCAQPKHAHTTSQAFYVWGSGGVEVPIASATAPFDIAGGEVLDVDVVFRDDADPTTFSLHIGCGGCGATDPLLAPPLVLTAHDTNPKRAEPFSQTRYRSVLTEDQRKFNASLLGACASSFTIRLVDFGNATTGTIVWTAVLGLEERFTASELLLFPVYMYVLHQRWNGLGFTWWLGLFLLAPLLLALGRVVFRACGWPVLEVRPFRVVLEEGRSCVTILLPQEGVEPRALLYEIALVGFVFTMLEVLIHLTYASIGAELDWALPVGLFVVLGLGNGLGIAVVCFSWRSMFLPLGDSRAGPLWGVAEIATAVLLLFLFGAGVFVGPAALAGAGILRLLELCTPPRCATDARYRKVPSALPAMPVSTAPRPPAPSAVSDRAFGALRPPRR